MNIIQSSYQSDLQDQFWRSLHTALSCMDVQKESIYIHLAGGSSLDIFYAVMREKFGGLAGEIREKVRFCLLDERIVPRDHEDRNERQLREKFLTTLAGEGSIGESQIVTVDITQSDIASEYMTRAPRIDIALVGVGPDGHIASLFPHHPLLDSQENCYLEISDSPKLPAHRITVSPVMIRDAEYVYIVIMKGKEIILERFNDDTTSLSECPAKMVKGVENLILMSDIEVDE